MKLITSPLQLAGAAFLALSFSAQAATLVTWDFTGNNPLDHAQNENAVGVVIASAGTYATDTAGVTSTDIIGRGNLDFSNGTNSGDGNVDEINLQSSTAAGWLFDFTVAVDPGSTINLTGLTINLWRNGGGAPDTMAFEVSTDGGATFSAFGTPDTEAATGLLADRDFNFTGDVTSENLVIRFAPTNSTGNLHISDIALTGTVSVPEPSTAALLGLGGLSLILRRKK